MKKVLLSIVALMMCFVSANAGDYTFSYTTGDGEGDGSVWTYLAEPFKIVQTKSGTVDINTTYAQLRLYKNHSLEISATESGVQITAVEFNCDTEAYATTMSGCTAETAGSWSVNSNVTTFTLDAASKTFKFKADQGQVRFSAITIYYIKEGEVNVTAPTISLAAGNLYEVSEVTLTAPEGDIYYAFDEDEYVKYTAPLTIDKTTTLHAYAQVGENKSSVRNAAYVMAQSYASLDVLLQETPTSTGWPVIVPIEDEEIADFYWSTAGENKYKNGVYLVRQANDTNFELYKSGVPDEWQIGDKLTGTAKGIYQNYNGQWEISLISWDGISNGAVIVEAPTISYDEATATVTITDPSGNNYTIYYTLDGSDPDDSQTLYEGPFQITASCTVKAVCYDDDDQKSSAASLDCKVAGAADYTDLASIVAAATGYTSSDAPTVTLKLTDILVTGVNNSNVFVKDDAGTAFLLYGKSSGLSRGDKISGIVEGKPYSYNGLPELSVTDSWANIAIDSKDNSVEPTPSTAANITADDANQFVSFSGVRFVSLDESSKHINYTFEQDGFQFNLYDNFDVLKDRVLSTGEAYTYSLDVFVIPYKENIQYYAVSSEDVIEYTTKVNAVCQFDDFADGQLFNMDYQTSASYARTITSDATEVIYETSDEEVATIDADGIYFHGSGVATLTMSVLETENYTAAKDSRTVRVWSGAAGTLDDAINVGDVKAFFIDGDTVKSVWVKAYIVGTAKSNMGSVVFGNGDGTQATNLVIAAKADETDANKCLPVELPKGDVRAALNLVDNPDNCGKEIWLYGNIIKYMSVAGLKTVSDFSFDGVVAVDKVIGERLEVGDEMYNLQGMKVDGSYKGIVIVGGKKYLNR